MTRRAITILFICTALLHLVPIWRVQLIPTVDGPSHLYNAAVLHELAHDTPAFHRVFRANLRPYPNWLGHLLLWVALFVAPPLAAEKLVVSLIVVTFLASCWTLAGVIDRGSRIYAFLAMPLAYHLLFQMGFYNYSLGVALAIFAVAFWWQRRGIEAAVCLLLCYFAHAVTAIVACVLMLVVWLIGRRWSRPLELLALMPAVALLVWFALQPHPPGGTWTWKGIFLWQPLLRIMLIDQPFGTVLAAIFALFIAMTLMARPRWHGVIPAAVAVVMYLAAPISVQEGLVLKARLLIFPYLLILPWLTPRLEKIAIAIPLAVLAVLFIGVVRNEWKRDDAFIRPAIAPFRHAVPMRTFVPLIFDASVPGTAHTTMRHVASYGAVERRLVDLADYEADFTFFPVAYRAGVVRPALYEIESAPANYDPQRWAAAVDYVFTWKMPAGSAIEARLNATYKVIASEGDARLYGH